MQESLTLTTCQRLVVNRLTNLYSDIIFPSFARKAVTSLTPTANFCLLKQQLQQLKVHQVKLNWKFANDMLRTSKQAFFFSPGVPYFSKLNHSHQALYLLVCLGINQQKISPKVN